MPIKVNKKAKARKKPCKHVWNISEGYPYNSTCSVCHTTRPSTADERRAYYAGLRAGCETTAKRIVATLLKDTGLGATVNFTW